MGEEGEVGLTVIEMEDDIKKIESTIDDFKKGKKANIAIIAEQFAGKTTLANKIYSKYKARAEMISLSSLVRDKNYFKNHEKDKNISIVENCHFLYIRKIGGFDIIENFLNNIIGQENKLYITTWNTHSWNFLEKSIEISKYFPIQIKIQGITKDQTKQFLLSVYNKEEIQFIEDKKELKEKKINFSIKRIHILNKEIGIPHLKIKYNLLKRMLSSNNFNPTPEEKVFDNIYSISKGNPGISKAIWSSSFTYPSIRPADIKDHCDKKKLDNDELFILSLLVASENVRIADLIEIAGEDIDIEKSLQVLSNENIICIKKQNCSVKPESLRCATDILISSRMV